MFKPSSLAEILEKFDGNGFRLAALILWLTALVVIVLFG